MKRSGLLSTLAAALEGLIPVGVLQSAIGRARGKQSRKSPGIVLPVKPASPEKHSRRQLVKAVGRRQALIETKTMRAAAKGNFEHKQLARKLAVIREAIHG